MFKVTEAKVLSGYSLWLRFADGVKGEVDLSDFAGRGVFGAWNDRSFFEDVHIDESGALTWRGDLDLCPDDLYLRVTGKAPEEVFPNLKSTGVHA